MEGRRKRARSAAPAADLATNLDLTTLLFTGPIAARIAHHLPDPLKTYGNLRLLNRYMRKHWTYHVSAVKGFSIIEQAKTQWGWTITTARGLLGRLFVGRRCMHGNCERMLSDSVIPALTAEIQLVHGNQKTVCAGCYQRAIVNAGGTHQYFNSLPHMVTWDVARTTVMGKIREMADADLRIMDHHMASHFVANWYFNAWRWPDFGIIGHTVGVFSGSGGAVTVYMISIARVLELAVENYPRFYEALREEIKRKYLESFIQESVAREEMEWEQAWRREQLRLYPFLEEVRPLAQPEDEPHPQ